MGPTAAPGAARLTMLDPNPDERRVLDGAWWPASTDLAREAPGLVAELHDRGIDVTSLVYSPVMWQSAPRRVPTLDGGIALGAMDRLDPNQVELTDEYGGVRVDLVVIRPRTSPEVAARVSAMLATGDSAVESASSLLERAAAGRTPARVTP